MALTQEQRDSLKTKFIRAMQAQHEAECWKPILPMLVDLNSETARLFLQAQQRAGATFNELMVEIDSL
jgi:hypothetical protein